MEGSLQKIIAAFVGVLIMFIVPVYISFEKVDDISYTLTLKHTQAFVDNVREKGYISPDMYTDFAMDIYSTNNSYNIEVQHIKKRYDPVIYIYDNKGRVLYKLDYDKYIETYRNTGIIEINGIPYQTNADHTISVGHVINEEVVTDKQIVKKLFTGTTINKSQFLLDYRAGNVDLYKSLVYMDENSYVMNEGDSIQVIVKNSNRTIATTFYSMLTANVDESDVPRIYVEYGGKIKNSGNAVLESDTGSINTSEGKIFKYRGRAEEVTLDEGTYEIMCWGASGGGETYEDVYGNKKFTGGKGGFSSAKITLDDPKTLYIYVGGQGLAYDVNFVSNAGFNGGGNSYIGFGGGGASDVRLVEDDEYNKERHTRSLMSRLIVAGGGGGASSQNRGTGGYAGNPAGDGAVTTGENTYVGKGALLSLTNVTITNNYPVEEDSITGIENIYEYENGTLGSGGDADYLGAGAGGGGFVGGSASHNKNAGGGGGSSYVYNNNLNSLSTIYTNISALQSVYDGITISDANIVNGNDTMDNPLAFVGGSDEITGNEGYGYVIIKRIS